MGEIHSSEFRKCPRLTIPSLPVQSVQSSKAGILVVGVRNELIDSFDAFLTLVIQLIVEIDQ